MKLKYRLLFLPILLFACGVASGQEAGMSVAPFVRGDTAVFRFAPEKRMFWADYKGNAIAIDSLARSIRQHKLSIESGDMKVSCTGILFLLRFLRREPCGCEESEQSGQILFHCP